MKSNFTWGFIYVFAINGRGYVGYTTQLKRRFKRHFREDKELYFHRSLKKYFKPKDFLVIETHFGEKKKILTLLKEREIFWVKELETLWPSGWNLTKGGDGLIGYIPTEEVLEKLRKPKPLGFAEKVSKRLKGVPKTEEQKQKISETRKLRKILPWNKGKKGSQIPWNKGKKCPQFSGINNPQFGKKRPDLAERNRKRKENPSTPTLNKR